VAEEAVRIRRQRRLKLPDAIILATARVHGLVLVTRNTKDFDPADPAIRIPYAL
jgi:predicted nucleic acid-binding protein